MKVSRQCFGVLLILSLLSSGVISPVHGENAGQDRKREVPKRVRQTALLYGPVFSGDFFVGVSGGLNGLLSAGDNYGGLGGQISPAFNLYVGKWLTPSIGLRVGYSGLTARGWTNKPSGYAYEQYSDGVWRKRMGFTYLHGDVLWNISNLLGGYRADRRWEFVPYLTAGLLRTNSRDGAGLSNNEFAAGAGLLNKIYLTDWMDFTLEFRQLLFKEDAVNPGMGGVAGMSSVTVGLDFNIASPDFLSWHPINRDRRSVWTENIELGSNRDENGNIIRGPYKTNRFFDNFFVSVGGGLQLLENENGIIHAWKSRISPALDVNVGKWFSPTVGARIGYAGLTIRDGVHLGYSNLHGDIMWNISNTIGGYKKERFWDFVPYLSAGWIHSFPLPGREGAGNNELGLGFGLLNVLRISDRVDLTLEGRQYIMPNSILPNGNGVAGMSSVTVGISVNLGGTDFERVIVPDMIWNTTNRDSTGKVIRGPYKTNKFFDNFFVGADGGVHFLVLENSRSAGGSAGGRISPALNIYVGKWFTPDVGLRIGYTGLSARGYATVETPYAPATESMPYPEKFGIAYLHGDALWNISNTIGGYKEDRLWDFVPYVTAGWLYSYSLDGPKAHDNEFAVGAGLINNIRLSKRVDLNLTLTQLLTRESLTKAAQGGVLGLTSVTLGVSVNLGKTGFERVRSLPEMPAVEMVAPVEELASEDSLSGVEKLQDTVSAAKTAVVCPSDTVVSKAALDSLLARPDTVFAGTVSEGAVFFEIGQTTLSSRELFHLDFYVRNVIALDKDKVFTITGCADAETGYPARNQQLSEQRVQYVYELMQTRYHIPVNRLIIKAIGAENNRYSSPELNRAVILE